MKMPYALGAAMLIAAAFGFGYAGRVHPTTSSTHPDAPGAPAAVVESGEGTTAGLAISGRVVETIDVAKYTYLRLATARGETWAAVPKSAVARGASVTVTNAAPMEHFTSTTLKRTFDVIYFGSLAGKGEVSGNLPPESEQPINGHVEAANDPGIPEALLDNPSGALPPGHPSIGNGAMPLVNGDQALPPGHPSIDDPGALPATGALPPGHPGDVPNTAPVAIPKLVRAAGPNGFRIVDLFANERRLVGQTVRVRAMVTKVTPDVLGMTFLHAKDGSGDAAAKTDDIAVMTSARPARGAVVVFEGVLRMNADLGIGYRYPALLDKATVVRTD